jgi:hypothetical protein
MNRRLFTLLTLTALLASCSSGGGTPKETTTTVSAAALRAEKIASAKNGIFSKASMPTTEEVGAIFRDNGLWGQFAQTESTSPIALEMRTRRTVCNGFGFDEIIKKYTPTRSLSTSFNYNFEGVSKEEMAKVSKYGVLTISIFDIGESSTNAPYNTVVDRFALQDGTCDVKMGLGYGQCPLLDSKRDVTVSVPVNEFGWTEDANVSSFNPKCKKPSGSYDMEATYSSVENDFISDGFKIVLKNPSPKNAVGGVLARTTHFFPQPDLGLLFLVELTHQDSTMTKSDYSQLTNANANRTQSVVESLFASWSSKLFTKANLSEISSLQSNSSGSGSTSDTQSQPKPSWKIGINPFADYNEAPYVQTACDMYLTDLPEAIGKDDVVKSIISTLRELERKYGIDAKEAAKNENLTYQDIWGGVGALIIHYDEYSADFRMPASFFITKGQCEDSGFTSVNEKFSSRNGGWDAVQD